jgi:dTDP-glucose 4,6-dehydratase
VSRRLLVTGGAGFIGANFCHYWAEQHPDDRLVVLDALTYAANPASLAPLLDAGRARLIEGDIGDPLLVGGLLAAEEIGTIVNFAAESHVDRSILDPQVFVRTNVLGTQVLLEAARATWGEEASARGRRFHHVSTDEVYGSLEPKDPAFTERTAYAPNSPYAASKAAADHLVRAYGRTYGLPCTVSNCSNNYGPYQFPEKLLPLCLVNLLDGRKLPIYGDGQQVREWLHVRDHCRALERILLDSPPGEAWNVGGGREQRNLDVVGQLCDAVDAAFDADADLAIRFPAAPAARRLASRSAIEFVRDRPAHDRRYAVDGSKLAAALGFRTEIPFAEGLAATVRWYLANEHWWRAVMDGTYRTWMTRHYGTAGPA